jgi:hypothetical protein
MMFETTCRACCVGDASSIIKRVAPAVGEGSVVVQQVHQYLEGRPARVTSG